MKLESPVTAALNYLLQSEPWARARLAPFEGEVLELRAPPLPVLRLAVAADGRLAAAHADAAATLLITVGPGAVAAALRSEEHLLRTLEVTGNVRLAGEVMFLFRHLRWDVEEDAAKVVGDIAAHRLVGLARGLAAWHADAAQRLVEGLVEYAVEEKRLLVKRDELEEIAAAQAQLRDGLERLARRLERLAG